MDKLVHKEAYCLMRYRCDKCGSVETLWNSRDGVTPFMIPCGSCFDIKHHIDFSSDMPMPKAFEPPKYMRVFTTYTFEEAIDSMNRRFDELRRLGRYTVSMDEAAIRREADEWVKRGEPNIKVAGVNFDRYRTL